MSSKMTQVPSALNDGGRWFRVARLWLAKVDSSVLPERHLLSYLDAILRIYNQYGRRDNKYKAVSRFW